MLYVVGVGPGDPELMTLKAVRLIQNAGALVYVDTGMGKSAVSAILGDLTAGKPLFPLSIPMRGTRDAWRQAHEEAAARLLDLLKQYETVVYPVLGDPGVYASSSYLVSLIKDRHPVTIVPGITAMCQAAAQLGIPLCEQREPVTILDSFQPGQTLPKGNVVVMKSGKTLAAIREAASGRKAYAVRNLGMEHEFCGLLADIPEDAYSYFTTVIVKAD